MFTDDDYVVEQYIRPGKVRKRLINDERADILGNFDDDDDKHCKKKSKKPKEMVIVSEENPFEDGVDSENENASENEVENGEPDEDEDATSDKEEENDEEIESANDDESMEAEEEEEDEATNEDHDSENVQSEPEIELPEKPQPKVKNNKEKSTEKAKSTTSKKPVKKLDLSDDQLKALMRGASKKDKFVLYITNLSYSTTRDTLTEFFSVAGTVKSVRIPKVRRNAFAFVEMSDITGFKVGSYIELNLPLLNCGIFYSARIFIEQLFISLKLLWSKTSNRINNYS